MRVECEYDSVSDLYLVISGNIKMKRKKMMFFFSFLEGSFGFFTIRFYCPQLPNLKEIHPNLIAV